MYMYVNKRVVLAQRGNSAIENYVLFIICCYHKWNKLYLNCFKLDSPPFRNAVGTSKECIQTSQDSFIPSGHPVIRYIETKPRP